MKNSPSGPVQKCDHLSRTSSVDPAEYLSGQGQNITQLIRLWKDGNQEAGDQLFAAVYPTFKKIANKLLKTHGGFHRLQATEVVNKAYLSMARQRNAGSLNRLDFLNVASCLINRTILDAMRYDRASVRDFRKETSDGAVPMHRDNGAPREEADLVREFELLDRALDDLRAKKPVAHLILMRKAFHNETLRAISRDLGISEDAGERKWGYAKAFLAARIEELRSSSQQQ